MRHLVTGGAGFIGSHLVDALVECGDEVTVLDDLSTGRPGNLDTALATGRVELVVGSMLDAPLVDRCLTAVDACFHLASAVGVRLIVSRPLDTLVTNLRGNDIVLAAAARRRKRLLFASTSEIYGKAQGGPLQEHSDRVFGSPLTARWGYGGAKALGESLARAYVTDRGADMIVARLFNTVGPRQSGAYGMVLPRFVRQALAGKPVTVYGDGTQSRCFVHVADTVRALLQLMDAPVAGRAFNVGSSSETSILALARHVVELARSDSPIVFVPYDQAYEGDGFEELGRRKPDTSAISQLTGWQPTRNLAETIADVIAYETAADAQNGSGAADAVAGHPGPSGAVGRLAAGSP